MVTYKLLRTPHNHYITHTLHHLFLQIGKRVSIVHEVNLDDNVDSTVMYVLTFSHRIDPMPKQYIVYQLEQMHTDNYKNNKKYKTKLQNSIQCWDYNASNTAFYTTKYPRVWLPVPIASVPNIFPTEPPPHQQPIDVLFYGSVNERRYIILKCVHDMLRPYAQTVKLVRGFYGESLYPYIRRARVVLNIGFYEDTLLATYRLNEVLAHNRVVVSEWTTHATDKHTIAEYKKGGVVFVPPIDASLDNIHSALLQPLVKLLTNNTYYMQQKQKGLRFVHEKESFFKQRLMSALRVVEQTTLP